MDGTLTDTLTTCVQAFRQALDPLTEKTFSDAEIIANFGPSEEGVIMALVPEKYDEGLARYLSIYEALLPASQGAFKGIRTLLAQLQQSGISLGLVTGKGPGSTRLTLSRFGLSPFFSDVASGSPKGSVKTVCIREIVDRWGFRPEDVVYVGDAPTDIEAAKEAGVRMIAVTWCPEADAATLTALNPDAVVESVEELRALLCRHDTTRTVRLGQRVQALAQTGLTFSKDRYDIDRYEALSDIAAQLMAYSPPSPGREELVTAFKNQLGYATPKVDVRGIVLRNGKVLLVREAEDGLWSLPGGWADVGDRPSGAISREIGEETGLDVRVDRLLGIWDRNLHDHPPYPFHVYKMIFLCTEQGGEIRLSAESLELDFFDPSQLPPLSVSRVVPLEIQTSIEIAERHMPAYFD